MDKNLLFTAAFNSGLLALYFTGSTLRNVLKESYLFAVIGLGATIFTIMDAVQFYNLYAGIK